MPFICIQRRRFPARGRRPRGRAGLMALMYILRSPLAPAVSRAGREEGREGGGSDRAGLDRSVPALRGGGAGRPLVTAAPDGQPGAEAGAAGWLLRSLPTPSPALSAPTGALPGREESWDPAGSRGPFWGPGDQGGSSEATGNVGRAGARMKVPNNQVRSCGCVCACPGGGLGCGFQGGD